MERRGDTEPEDDIIQEATLSQIRNVVNENKIKLWTNPYYDASGPSEEKLLQTANALASTLEMDDLEILKGLKQLQANALEKLRARDVLNESGKIKLKLKVDKNLVKLGKPKIMSIEGEATGSGQALYELVGREVGFDPDQFRLISAGKIIGPDCSLNEQNLKPGQTIMLVTIDQNDKSVQIVSEQRRILNMAKEDANLLGTNDELTIADQSGKAIDLPKAERQSIILAMSLHEKGRTAMKKNDNGLALVLLLEAKVEYNNCRSELLEAVDNYALLNLDIAWCYLLMGNVSELPNADERLKECERNFAKSYGKNLERLEALKGSASNEAVLYVRMHLLQAIVAFHAGFRAKAVELFRRASAELEKLKVPQDVLDEVVAQGFTRIEARTALRATGNNVTAAVKLATENRRKKAEETTAERDRQKKRRKLGKTADGSWVNLGYLNTLVKMGFEEALASKALRHTNNDIDASVDVMNDSPELLLTDSLDNDEVSKETIHAITSMGFDADVAEEVLHSCKGNMGEAVDILTRSPDLVTEIMAKAEDKKAKGQEKKAKTEEARQRIEEEIRDGEDHLDLTLDEEETYLVRYKGFLGLL